MKLTFLIAFTSLCLMLSGCSTADIDLETNSASHSNAPSENEAISSEEVAESGISMPGVVNPFVEVESSLDFKQDLNINLFAPETAQNIHYSIMNNSMAQIVYTLDSTEYTLRASYTEKSSDMHGIYDEYLSDDLTAEVDGENYSFSVNSKETVNGYFVAEGTLNIADAMPLYFSLTTSNKTSIDDMLNSLTDIITNSSSN